MVDLQTLQRFPYFADLDTESLRHVSMITELKSVPAGTQMFTEGDDADFLYVIVRGHVEIAYPLGSDTRLNIQTLSSGDLLVWSAILEPHLATSTGTTTEETSLLAIDAKKLRDLFEVDPLLAHALTHQVAKMLAERLALARSKFATLLETLGEVLEESRV